MVQLFQLIQTAYWVGLSTWFGATLFLAIAAPIVLRTVREHDPTLPGVLSVNLDAQHSTLLGGTIVSRMMRAVSRVSLGCAVAVLIGLVGQAVIIQPVGSERVRLITRAALFSFATIVLVYDWWHLAPRLFAQRERYIEHADNPDVANAAQDQVERLSRESVNLLFLQTLLLLGVVLFSVNIFYIRLGGD